MHGPMNNPQKAWIYPTTGFGTSVDQTSMPDRHDVYPSSSIALYAMRRPREDSYIRIDEECIHQDDDTDHEQHLQLMHRIYRASSVTIAMLSTYIPTLEVFEEFVIWALGNDNDVNKSH
jgi:hypothetical protein